MTNRAKLTSDLSAPFPKKRCLISSEIQAEIEFKLDEIVDRAAANIAAISPRPRMVAFQLE